MARLGAVTAAHRFDAARLGKYLKAAGLDGLDQATTVQQFQGGQSNPTFLLTAGGRRYVLRKKPPGDLLPSAHLVEREYRVMKALAATDVPVPRMHLLCEDPDVIGTAFFVMDHVEGRILPDPAVPEAKTPEERGALYAAMTECLACLHKVDWQAIGLADFGKPQHYVARQVDRWIRQYHAAKTQEIPAMDRLMAWLPENLPGDETVTIAHGDFRLDNLIMAPDRAEVLAVLDWELSTLGHPPGDLAYMCMPYRMPAGTPGLRGLVGVDLAALGIPDEAETVATYCRHTGRAAIPDFDFYMAFSMFRLASICQGVYARALQGNASSENAVQIGRMAPVLAEAGWRTVEGMGN